MPLQGRTQKQGLSAATAIFQNKFVYSHYQKHTATEVDLEEFWNSKIMK